MPPLLFDYRPSPLRIIDNGHTIQVNYAPGSTVSVAGTRYELVEFHFHKPGEEKISGKGHDMEAQLVHRGKDGKLAVIAVLLDEGNESALIKTLWANLPQTKDKENVVDAVKINALELILATKAITFAGSLTTRCAGVTPMVVLKTPTQLSTDARFAKSYPMNARPCRNSPRGTSGHYSQATRPAQESARRLKAGRAFSRSTLAAAWVRRVTVAARVGAPRLAIPRILARGAPPGPRVRPRPGASRETMLPGRPRWRRADSPSICYAGPRRASRDY